MPLILTGAVTLTGAVQASGSGQSAAPAPAPPAGPTTKAIFGYGNQSGSYQSITNLVSNTGVVAANVTGVGTARAELAAAGYGGDKAIFGYGQSGSGAVSLTNLVSNTGVGIH